MRFRGFWFGFVVVEGICLVNFDSFNMFICCCCCFLRYLLLKWLEIYFLFFCYLDLNRLAAALLGHRHIWLHSTIHKQINKCWIIILFNLFSLLSVYGSIFDLNSIYLYKHTHTHTHMFISPRILQMKSSTFTFVLLTCKYRCVVWVSEWGHLF